MTHLGFVAGQRLPNAPGAACFEVGRGARAGRATHRKHYPRQYEITSSWRAIPFAIGADVAPGRPTANSIREGAFPAKASWNSRTKCRPRGCMPTDETKRLRGARQGFSKPPRSWKAANQDAFALALGKGKAPTPARSGVGAKGAGKSAQAAWRWEAAARASSMRRTLATIFLMVCFSLTRSCGWSLRPAFFRPATSMTSL